MRAFTQRSISTTTPETFDADAIDVSTYESGGFSPLRRWVYDETETIVETRVDSMEREFYGNNELRVWLSKFD
jgi:hypothetical protein